MDHRINELRLRIRARPDCRPGMQADAERFTRSVLERLADRLEAEDPQRLVFIRELSLNWCLSEQQLTDSTIADRYARHIHERVRNENPLGLDIHPSDTARDIAIFENESLWRAAHLLARSRNGREQAWFFKNLEVEGDPLDVLASPNRRQLAWEVLERLASHHGLTELVRASPPGKLTTLAQRLLANEKLDDQPNLPRVPSTTTSLTEQLLSVVRGLRAGLPLPAVALVLVAHARVMLGPTSHQVAGVVNDCLFQLEREVSGMGTPPHLGAPESAWEPVPATRQDRHPLDSALPLDRSTESSRTEDAERFAGESISVQAGGLFYLLNCALELNLGEVLWKACLPEPLVFAQALAALLGEELAGDPGIALFAGCRPSENEIQITDDQLVEVSDRFLAALAAALPRRGLASFPETILSLEIRSKEYLLVARPLGSPFVLFARPAPAPRDARPAIDSFLAGWPRSAPAPCAPPALAELDRTGRLRTLHHDQPSVAPFVPQTGSASTTALLAQTIGILCHLLEARAKATKSAKPTQFIERFLRLAAEVRVTSEQLTVVIPAAKVDLHLRRAGLDRDPGWVPWFHKTVRFEFVGQEEAKPNVGPH